MKPRKLFKITCSFYPGIVWWSLCDILLKLAEQKLRIVQGRAILNLSYIVLITPKQSFHRITSPVYVYFRSISLIKTFRFAAFGGAHAMKTYYVLQRSSTDTISHDQSEWSNFVERTINKLTHTLCSTASSNQRCNQSRYRTDLFHMEASWGLQLRPLNIGYSRTGSEVTTPLLLAFSTLVEETRTVANCYSASPD